MAIHNTGAASFLKQLCASLCLRMQNPVQVSVVFPVGTANYSSEMIKTLWSVLSHRLKRIFKIVSDF